MKRESLISVIVPCYNHSHFIIETLKCIQQQSYSNWECLIINDGSTDDSEEVILNWIEKDPRFVYIYKKNSGVSDSRNLGIAKSKGIYILPLDSDDKISRTYLQEGVKILDNDLGIHVVYCEAEFFGAKSGKWDLPAFSPKEMLCRNIVFCSAIFRRNIFNKTMGYNQNMKNGLEDWDLWLSFLENDAIFYKLPDVHFYYRISEGSRNNSINNSRYKELCIKIYINHINLYMSYFDAPQELLLKYKELKYSKEYKIGALILNPLRKLFKSFKYAKSFSSASKL